jgi:catechol-2,3-dioxygenase
VALGARDVERVATFYREAFGLAEDARHHAGAELRSIWLRLGPGVVLMIERTDDERPRRQGVAAGPFLLAFRIEEGERADRERRLEELGAAVESRSAFSSYARDPEGNRVAISFHPLGSSA